MPDFRAVTDRYGGLVKSSRFIARIMPTGKYLLALSQQNPAFRDLMYLCESTELPGRGFLSVDIRYYGPSHKLPYQSNYEDCNMSFLCRSDSLERKFFDDWMTLINPINTFDFNYRDDYRANIEIFQIGDAVDPTSVESGVSTDPQAKYAFTLLNAYPTLVNPQAVTWADQDFLRLGISFTYSWWTRKFLDPEPGAQEGNFAFDLVKGYSNKY